MKSADELAVGAFDSYAKENRQGYPTQRGKCVEPEGWRGSDVHDNQVPHEVGAPLLDFRLHLSIFDCTSPFLTAPLHF
jgi:hypothetical protein